MEKQRIEMLMDYEDERKTTLTKNRKNNSDKLQIRTD